MHTSTNTGIIRIRNISYDLIDPAILLTSSWLHTCHGFGAKLVTFTPLLLNINTHPKETPTNQQSTIFSSEQEVQIIWKRHCQQVQLDAGGLRKDSDIPSLSPKSGLAQPTAPFAFSLTGHRSLHFKGSQSMPWQRALPKRAGHWTAVKWRNSLEKSHSPETDFFFSTETGHTVLSD